MKEGYTFSNQKDISDIFEHYVGKPVSKIARLMSLNHSRMISKLSTVQLVNSILEYEGFNIESLVDGDEIEEISLKTVTLELSGNAKESMSFEQIRFDELVNEDWHTSRLRDKFLKTTFLFFVFQYIESKSENPNRELIFRGILLWKMPIHTLDSSFKKTWCRTKYLAMNGVELKEEKRGANYRTVNNLPGSTFNGVAHVRPKARDSNDKVELPSGQSIVKQAFWLNNTYISEIVQAIEPLNKESRYTSISFKEMNVDQIELFKKLFQRPIYTIDEFCEIANNQIENFERDYLNNRNLRKFGYRLVPHFVLSYRYESADHYFNEMIFSQDFFIKEEGVSYSPYFNSKLEKLNHSLDLLKLEESTYITFAKLQEANISKRDLIDYREKVEAFIGEDDYFNITFLESSGFVNPLESYGFEDTFYESVLKTSMKLQSIKLSGNLFFVKSKGSASTRDLIANLVAKDSMMSVVKILEEIRSAYQVIITEEYLVNLLKRSSLFYSEELQKVFIDKEDYYEEVYG